MVRYSCFANAKRNSPRTGYINLLALLVRAAFI